MLDLTIALPTKNEAEILPDCLRAIGKGFARKVVVIDSGSTDKTVEVAENFGATVIDFKWNGRFPKKRNWYLRTHKPDTGWVLFIDADEVVTDAFKEEVDLNLKKTPHNGFWLSYQNYFSGKPLRGGYPLKKLALFRVGKGEYERIEEEAWSHLDMEIHEHPIVEGSTGHIKARIDHRDHRSLKAWQEKHVAYAQWEAHRVKQLLTHPRSAKCFTIPQRIKYLLIRSALIGPVFFLGSFFLMGGFVDGRRGYQWAKLKASYFNDIRRHLKTLNT